MVPDDEILFTNFTYNPNYYYFLYVGELKTYSLNYFVQEAYVRSCYIFNCSYRNPQFTHFRVPVEVGRGIVESMYGNISGDAIPRYIATAGGKIALHRSNVVSSEDSGLTLRKP